VTFPSLAGSCDLWHPFLLSPGRATCNTLAGVHPKGTPRAPSPMVYSLWHTCVPSTTIFALLNTLCSHFPIFSCYGTFHISLFSGHNVLFTVTKRTTLIRYFQFFKFYLIF
jgi:hypothetical protein